MRQKKKLVYGVGVNDAGYVIQLWETIGYVNRKRKRKQVWICPFYLVWKCMLARGYSEKYKNKHATYEDVTVCGEWLTFSNFKRWMEKQDWEGNYLDKDLLIPGNKVYSPEACIFVSRQVNTFLIERGADRGEYKIGVYWHKLRSKYRAQCSNPFTKKIEHLGYYLTEEAAHQAWLSKKLQHAYALADIQSDLRVAKALIERYENYKCEDS